MLIHLKQKQDIFMNNEKETIRKIVDFLNSLSWEEMVFLRRFRTTKRFQNFLETRLNNKKIES